MKAVVVHGPGDVRIDERPEPVPAAGEVLLAVEWGGICGSDLSYWKYGSSGTAVLKHPLVLGHEVAGLIVTGADAGRAATVHPATIESQETLPERISGRTNLHSRIRYFGSAAFDPHTDGAFSEYKVVRTDQIRLLPDGVSTRHGALAEPLAVALHAISRAGAVRDRNVLVNGAGPIGALVVAAAKHHGARTVIAADVSPARLKVAQAMGADEVRDISAGDGLPDNVEVVFEASGVTAALGGVLRATARGGTLVQVGNLPGVPSPAVLGDLVTREITWTGSYRFVEEITDALAAMRDGLDVDPLISHTFGIGHAAEALATAADPASGSSKVMLRLGTP